MGIGGVLIAGHQSRNGKYQQIGQWFRGSIANRRDKTIQPIFMLRCSIGRVSEAEFCRWAFSSKDFIPRNQDLASSQTAILDLGMRSGRTGCRGAHVAHLFVLLVLLASKPLFVCSARGAWRPSVQGGDQLLSNPTGSWTSSHASGAAEGGYRATKRMMFSDILYVS